MAKNPCFADINVLPNELLLNIFEHLYEPDGILHIPASQVCRRFRSLIVGTPVFWTHVTNTGPLAWTQMYLDRSASAPINIIIADDNCWESYRGESWDPCKPCRCLDFVEAVMKHAHRWHSFFCDHSRFHLDEDDEDTHRIAQRQRKIFDRSRGLIMPLLHNLSIYHNGENPEDESVEFSAYFANVWEMPNLRCLETDTSIRFLRLSSDLDSVSLTLATSRINPRPFALGHIFRILESPAISNITDLRLDTTKFVCDEQAIGLRNHPVEFPGLEMFAFSVGARRRSGLDCVDFIVGRLNMPKVTMISAKFNVQRGWEALDAFLRWLEMENHQRLRSLYLTIAWSREVAHNIGTPDILGACLLSDFLLCIAKPWFAIRARERGLQVYYRFALVEYDSGEYDYGEYRSVDWEQVPMQDHQSQQ